jgi:hypothetical protein
VTPAVQRRLRLLAASVALTVLAFVQAPGRIAPDTKLDLSVDPLGFLLRAWNLWEPLGASGQLQNQAYGYFIPMGPFYLIGNVLGFPAWIVQRAWWALILVVAFLGMYRLLGRMEVGVHSTQMIAALAYALSPRMITELGPVSIEAWPIAMAPWVLLPLIKVTPGSEATAAARSGLAVALCGGVNAVAVGAVLPLPMWWLMTREKSRCGASSRAGGRSPPSAGRSGGWGRCCSRPLQSTVPRLGGERGGQYLEGVDTRRLPGHDAVGGVVPAAAADLAGRLVGPVVAGRHPAGLAADLPRPARDGPPRHPEPRVPHRRPPSAACCC